MSNKAEQKEMSRLRELLTQSELENSRLSLLLTEQTGQIKVLREKILELLALQPRPKSVE
jgi:hypothetical protein